jgi:hypothetical protein
MHQLLLFLKSDSGTSLAKFCAHFEDRHDPSCETALG